MTTETKSRSYSQFPIELRKELWEMAKTANFSPNGMDKITERCKTANISYKSIHCMIANYKTGYLLSGQEPLALYGPPKFPPVSKSSSTITIPAPGISTPKDLIKA